MYKVVAMHSEWGMWAQEFNTHEAAIVCEEFLKAKVTHVTIIPDNPDELEENGE